MLFCPYRTIPSHLLLATRRVVLTLRSQWPYKGLLPVSSMSTVPVGSGRDFFSIPLPHFPPAQFNLKNGGSMLFRNSGVHMQNYMSHGQLSIMTTLQAGRSWVRILAGPRYFYVFFNVQTGCGSHWPSYDILVLSHLVMRPERESDASIERRY